MRQRRGHRIRNYHSGNSMNERSAPPVSLVKKRCEQAASWTQTRCGQSPRAVENYCASFFSDDIRKRSFANARRILKSRPPRLNAASLRHNTSKPRLGP